MKKITKEMKDKMFELRGNGLSYSKIAQQLGISQGSVSLLCRKSTKPKTGTVVEHKEVVKDSLIADLKMRNKVLLDILKDSFRQ